MLRASLACGVRALEHANAHLDIAQAERAVDALVGCRGRRFVTGVGKSGHAAQRMAASLTSIGLQSTWVHGTEWAHGEHGGVGEMDLIACVSHSGKTAELLDLCEALDARGLLANSEVTLMALTGNPASPLSERADIALTCAVPADAELLGVLPTASVLAAHHVFNAVLAGCAESRGLTRRDIALHHPGGSIGRRLVPEASGRAPRPGVHGDVR